MKSLYLTFLLLIASTMLFGQITINSNTHRPSIGDSVKYINSPDPISVSNGGANATWDLSAVVGTEAVTNFINPADAQESASFPLSTIVESSLGAEVYFINTSSESNLKGLFQPGVVRVVYDDLREALVFPFTFGDTYDGTFDGVTENLQIGQTLTMNGTVHIESDGYGTLILPYKSVNNVLKVTTSADYTLSLSGVPLFTITDTIIYWFDSNNKFPLATNTVSYNSGVQLQVATSIISADDIISGIQKTELPKWISYYPNPAINRITITNNGAISLLELIDLSGRIISRKKALNYGVNTMDVSQVAPGVYFMVFHTSEGIFTERIVLE